MGITRYKHPRIPHLPWSEGMTSDDKMIEDLYSLDDNVSITKKMDGENTTIYEDGFVHARSIDSSHHWSRSWIKGFAASLVGKIPKGIRICGENLYATHSIKYNDLPSYFLMFGAWYGNILMRWGYIEHLAQQLGIPTVEEIWRGKFDKERIKKIKINEFTEEGYVVRCSDEIHMDEFKLKCAKYVRKGHVQSDEHWMFNSRETNSIGNISI